MKKALNRLEELKSSNSEHYKHQNYIRKLIDFPWLSPTQDDDIFTIIQNDSPACINFIDNENFFSIVSKKSRFYLYANVEAELCELDESEKLTPADLKEGLEAMTSPAPEGAE